MPQKTAGFSVVFRGVQKEIGDMKWVNQGVAGILQ